MIQPDNNYFVKAAFPPGNSWREANLTRYNAESRAMWFVRQWRDNGLATAKAAVFHNSGKLIWEANVDNCDARNGRKEARAKLSEGATTAQERLAGQSASDFGL